WTLGEYEVILRGGTNALSGKQSQLKIDTIIALDSDKNPTKYKKFMTPTLTNKTLFNRDRFLCAYCGNTYNHSQLTRDHVIPSSKGGPDTWVNVVTCCGPCNRWKDDKTPEEAGMQLLYVPYIPTYNEHLI